MRGIPDTLVLFVDDDDHVRSTIEFAFGDELHLKTAASGDEALAIAEHEEIGVLVADQRMPGMTGVDLCAAIARRSPDTVRIILTAYADLEVATAAIERGRVHRLLQKPFRNEDLLEALAIATRLHEAARARRSLQRSVFSAAEAVRAARAELAHEVRNLIHPMLRMQESLLTTMHLGEASTEEVLTTAERCAAFHREVLAVCDAVLGEERIGGSSLVREVVSTLGEAYPLRVDVEAPSSARVPMSRAAFAQVCANLLSNAVEAGASRVAVRVGRNARELRVVFRDDGHGLPEGVGDVFASGMSTRDGAAGLGLAISRRLVRSTGGELALLDDAPGTSLVLSWATSKKYY